MSRMLCDKCRMGFRHNRATCGVCDATSHLKCRALSRRKRERLKRGLRSWSCCKQTVTMTMLNSDLQHSLHQSAMKSFVTPITVLSLSTSTWSECHRVIKKSSLRATCTSCGQSSYLVCTYLPRHERGSIQLAAKNGVVAT